MLIQNASTSSGSDSAEDLGPLRNDCLERAASPAELTTIQAERAEDDDRADERDRDRARHDTRDAVAGRDGGRRPPRWSTARGPPVVRSGADAATA